MILIIKIIGISALIANVLTSEPYLLFINKFISNEKLKSFLQCPLCFGFWLSILPAIILSNGDIIAFFAIIGLIPVMAEFITRKLKQIFING